MDTSATYNLHDAKGSYYTSTCLPVAFLSHTFAKTQRKFSTSEQEVYGVYYAITKWNYYLQGANIIVCNDHKPLANFLNGKECQQQGQKMETRTCDLQHYILMDLRSMKQVYWLPLQIVWTTKWYQSHNKDAHRNQFQWTSIQHKEQNVTPMPNNHNFRTLQYSTWQGNCQNTQDVTPKTLTDDEHEALLQMQKMDPFCKCISKRLSKGKAPKHEADLFTHVKGLLYIHIMGANQKFMALIIPKACKYTVPVEAHGKFRHQGVICMYYLIKWQYYWIEMNEDIGNT